MLRTNGLDVGIDLAGHHSQAQREVVTLSDLMRKPAHAGELPTGGRLMAGHLPQGPTEAGEAFGLSDRARQRAMQVLVVAVRDVVGIGADLPRTRLTLDTWSAHRLHFGHLPSLVGGGAPGPFCE